MGHRFVRDDELSTRIELTNNDRYIITVADGMGGHNCGDVASNDVLHNLEFFYYDMPTGFNPSEFNEAIVEWLDSINNTIAAKGRADERFKGMGTTLVGIAYYEGNFYSLNCGDSRLYSFRDGILTQLTTDHSLSNMLGTERTSSIITNCIGGGSSSSYIDIVMMTNDIQVGDSYLLCSDGLTDMLKNEKICKLLTNGANANDLCNAAILAGGIDNVSCCLISC